VSIVGFAALGAAYAGMLPLLATFVVLQITRRSTEFILTNPSRKVLFTVLSREDKYKASNFLETFVYRGGDQVSVWGYDGLVRIGASLASIAWIASGLSIAFMGMGVWLGRRQQEMAERQEAQHAAVVPGDPLRSRDQKDVLRGSGVP
jgi:AAA family ATP:ADP antiporter